MDAKKGAPEKMKCRGHILRLPARASIWYTAASLTVRGISFAATPLFTRALSASEYGIYPLYTGWMSLISALMTLEMGGIGLYSGFARYGDGENEFTKSALIALYSVFLASSVPFLIFIKSLCVLCGLPIPVLLLMQLHIIAEATVTLFCTQRRFFYRYRSVFIISTVPALAAPFISFFFIKYTPPYARIMGQALPSVMTAAALLTSFAVKRNGKASAGAVKYAFLSNAALLPHMLASAALANTNKLIIAKMHGDAALAKYSVAHSLGLILTFATVGIYGALKPWMIRKLRAGRSDAVVRTVGGLFSIFCILTVALTAVAPEIFGILAPSEYRDGLSCVYPLALAVLPMFLCNISSSVLMSEGRMWVLSLCTVAVAAVNAGMNAVLLKHLSFTSSAVAFLVSYLILSVCVRLVVKDRSTVGGGLYGMFAATSAAVVLTYLLRGFPLVRLGFLLALSFPLAFAAVKLFSAIKEK